MKYINPAKRIAVGLAAGSFLFSSAATAAVRPIDYVANSTLLTAANYQAATCATSAASAAATGAVSVSQAVQTQPNCVLPVADAAPAPVTTAAPPVYTEPAVGGGIGVLPVLLGLAAIAGGLALLLSGDDEDSIELPVSPG